MKYAVVTGGTSGMGLGVAKMLVSKGYYVLQHTLVQISQNMLRTSKLSKPIRRIVRKCIGSSIM